jgi:hypothetical protein
MKNLLSKLAKLNGLLVVLAIACASVGCGGETSEETDDNSGDTTAVESDALTANPREHYDIVWNLLSNGWFTKNHATHSRVRVCFSGIHETHSNEHGTAAGGSGVDYSIDSYSGGRWTNRHNGHFGPNPAKPVCYGPITVPTSHVRTHVECLSDPNDYKGECKGYVTTYTN